MLDFLRRDGDSSNTVIGVILLVMLLVFVGPNVIPSVLSRTFPFIDEGIPCEALRSSQDRGSHQSLIGRSATDPLILRTTVAPLPQADNIENNFWVIRITVQNNTIGTVPIVFNEDQVIVGDNGTTGLGLLFSPQLGLQTSGTRPAQSGTFPESDIKLLGPRQRCVHRVQFPAIAANVNTIPQGTEVRAYYRITANGTVAGGGGSNVFTDQGLGILANGIGVIQSEPAIVPFSAFAN